jgi:hypothetical protein
MTANAAAFSAWKERSASQESWNLSCSRDGPVIRTGARFFRVWTETMHEKNASAGNDISSLLPQVEIT